jgi:phosphoribosylglycinamide formyltransferase-1
MQNIAIFASGEGTNAENIIRYFQDKKSANVAVVVYNRAEAGVKQRAVRLGVPAVYLPKAEFLDEQKLMSLLRQYQISFVVLSGFLVLVPDFLIRKFPDRIVNIHPALMPKHCGKGMYGMKVHEEVVADRDKESGITIHLVDEDYDHGRIVFQAKCPVLPEDSPEDVAQHVHKLEYANYPQIIEELILGERK